MAAADKIIQLRRLLEEKHGTATVAGGSGLMTGLEALDQLDIPQGSLTEIVADPAASGGALLLAALLKAATKQHRVALIDGTDAFDPSTVPAGTRVLWIRCGDALQAAKVADLVARDGNISLVILFLTLNSPSELRRIHANTWHRLQMLVEKSGTSLLAFTPSAQIGNARLRLNVSGHFPLGAIEISQAKLEPRLSLSVQRRRISTGANDVLRSVASA